MEKFFNFARAYTHDVQMKWDFMKYDSMYLQIGFLKQWPQIERYCLESEGKNPLNHLDIN